MEKIKITKAKKSKAERIEQEMSNLQHELSTGEFVTLRARVAFILSKFPESRNSDLELQLRYWDTFQHDKYKYGQTVSNDLYKQLDRLTTLVRMRAKIQNEYKLYQAEKKIKQFRISRALQYTDVMIADRELGNQSTYAYCDETGKSSKFLGVGGIWFNNSTSGWKIQQEIMEWKKENGINIGEFHFNKISRGSVPHAKEFFRRVLRHSGTFGFKAVFVERDGLKHSLDDAIRELHFHFACKGVDHEVAVGRSSLPIQITLLKDEEPGSDKLHMERLKEDLITEFDKRYRDKVILENVFTPPSKNNYLIQVADLFMASLNRVMERNPAEENNHHRDDLADFILESIGITYDGQNFDLKEQDFVTIFFIDQTGK